MTFQARSVDDLARKLRFLWDNPPASRAHERKRPALRPHPLLHGNPPRQPLPRCCKALRPSIWGLRPKHSNEAQERRGARGRKGARAQGRKGARPRAQGRKGARAQGRKGARAQGRKGARAQGRKGARAQGRKGRRGDKDDEGRQGRPATGRPRFRAFSPVFDFRTRRVPGCATRTSCPVPALGGSAGSSLSARSTVSGCTEVKAESPTLRVSSSSLGAPARRA